MSEEEIGEEIGVSSISDSEGRKLNERRVFLREEIGEEIGVSSISDSEGRKLNERRVFL